MAVFVNQSAQDVGSLNGEAGILASDEGSAGQGWALAKGSVPAILWGCLGSTERESLIG